jgi:hypothetical protein
MSVNKWIDIIPPNMEIPIDFGIMYIICLDHIDRLSDMDIIRNFVVHKHYFRNG